MGVWDKGFASSPQGKPSHQAGSPTAGAAAVNQLREQYDKPVRWRLQGRLEERIEAWYQPITRSTRQSAFSSVWSCNLPKLQHKLRL